MPTEIPWETRCAAEDAYILDGLTYDQVAARTGVSVSQVKRWGAEGDWPARKKEYRDALSGIKRDTVRLRQKLLEQALSTLDPQSVYAAARMEQVAAAAGKSGSTVPADVPADITIETPQQAVEALQSAMEQRIGRMAGGNIDLAGLKQVQQCMDLIEKLKSKYAPAASTKKSLTEKQLKEIREQLKL